MLTEEIVNNAYAVLEDAKKKLFVVGEKVITRKLELEYAKLSALSSGKIEGKNAELREAAAREYLEAEYESLESAEVDERRARQDYDIAEIEVYRVRALLRLYEIEKVQE